MRVVFVSNYLNHHQLPFCTAMWQSLGEEFCAIFVTSMSKERKELGWSAEKAKPYEVRAYKSDEDYARACEIIDAADVVILGSAPDKLIEKRLKQKKLTIRYSERFYKTGRPLKRLLRDAAAAWLHHGRFQRYPLHMLCASAYTPADAARFGNYLGRCYKWGYFPPTYHYEEEELFAGKKGEVPNILWVGRFLTLKHPDDALDALSRLREEGYVFRMKFIGTGPLEASLRDTIEERGLGECISILGTMTPEQVREHMEQANIYLFTSDHNEGWGAVLNESMNSGCAVVASHAIGAVPFLVKHGENGFVYQSGSVEDLYSKIKYLLDKPDEQMRIGRNALHTIVDSWNAEEAARRLPLLAQDLQEHGVSNRFADGPCSKAQVIKDEWFADKK